MRHPGIEGGEVPDWVGPFIDAELMHMQPWEVTGIPRNVVGVPRQWFAWKRALEAARAKAHES